MGIPKSPYWKVKSAEEKEYSICYNLETDCFFKRLNSLPVTEVQNAATRSFRLQAT